MLNNHRMLAPIFIVAGVAAVSINCCAMSTSSRRLEAGNGKQWYKGNTHTHTLWSDGDAAPEYAVSWYKENGYDFLSITDHNVILRGDKEVAILPDSRLSPERVDQLKQKFGADTVNVSSKEGKPVMRLRTFDQLQAQFDEPEKFLLIEGEEITGVTHVNGINIGKVLRPSKFKGNVDSIRWNDSTYTVAARPEAGVTYTTRFIGTRKGYNPGSGYITGPDGTPMTHRTKIYDKSVGEVLYETTDNPAVY